MMDTNWRKIIRKYNKVDLRKSNWQLITTLSLYIFAWFLAYEVYQISQWLCLGVALLAQVFFGRLFIILHDLGHGTFYKNRKVRTIWGNILGILWFTPFEQWTNAHAIHHRHSGNLDHRGTGDIWVLTTEEYENASLLKKLAYRICRFPPFVLFFGGLYVYFIAQRFYMKTDGAKEKRSVWVTNMGIVLMGLVISSLTSAKFFFFYQFFLIYFGSSLAVFFFYVQHQYEDVYWEHTDNWSYETAALEGCSNLEVPRWVQWASGNIGFHHIHHLSHNIPNYNLEKAYKENPMFQQATNLTLWECLKCFQLALYDMNERRMITFREYSQAPGLGRNYSLNISG